MASFQSQKVSQLSHGTLLLEIEEWVEVLTEYNLSLKNYIQNQADVQMDKFHRNSVEICLTQIQSLLLKLQKKKKQYQKCGKQNFSRQIGNAQQKLINDYSALSNDFNQILQKISNIEQDKLQPNKSRSVFEQDFSKTDFRFKKSTKKAYSALKNQSSRGNKSSSFSGSILKGKTANKSFSKKSRANRSVIDFTLQTSNFRQETISGLSKIKSMLKELQNEVHFHEHEDLKIEISKINTQNRKMTSELRVVREQNRNIERKLQMMKDQLEQEKKNQVTEIKSHSRFNKDRNNTYANMLSRQSVQEDSTHGQSQLHDQYSGTHKADVSDWVRARI